MKYLALDFGGTFVKHCIMDDDINITERGEIPSVLDSSDTFVKIITDLYEEVKGKVDGVAISMPGVIDSNTGHLYSAGAFTGAMGGKNLFELLEGKIDVPVAVENDGKAAVLAEQWKGSLQGVNTAAAIIIGSGLGGGIIMDGRLRKGAHFASGEISGLLVEPGKYDMSNFSAMQAATTGLLMAVAFAKGMSPAQFEISGFAGDFGEPDPNLPIYSGRDVFRWVEEGDEVTAAVFSRWIACLVQVIYNLKMTLDPEKIVIGGGVSRNPLLLKAIKEEYAKAGPLLAAFGMPELEIDTCTFTADANMIGAVCNWKMHYE